MINFTLTNSPKPSSDNSRPKPEFFKVKTRILDSTEGKLDGRSHGPINEDHTAFDFCCNLSPTLDFSRKRRGVQTKWSSVC